MKVLLIIDYQNDFCEGGPLAYKDSLEIIPMINRIRYKFDTVIFTKDWHPYNHSSFIKYGGMYQQHCIQDTKGAEINDNILRSKKDYIITKGTYQLYDTCSAFYDAKEINKRTKLESILKSNNMQEIYICGNGLENCIFSTLMDCARFDIKCTLIIDCVTYDNMDDTKYIECLNFLKTLKINIVNSTDLSY
jgi:nicotinamidase/pyrazinamidase